MSFFDPESALSDLKKKRGSIHGTITRLSHRVQDFEHNPNVANLARRVNRVIDKLTDLNCGYKEIHYQISRRKAN